MKKIFIIIIAILSLFTLSSCKSSYKATLLMKSELNNNCKVRFYSLKGTLVLNTSVDPDETNVIFYEGTLNEGEINVYYEVGEDKKLIFTIKGGEELSGDTPFSKIGSHVNIVVETIGKAKGGELNIRFE